MQTRRQPIPQLRGIGRQINAYLLQTPNHGPCRGRIAHKLPAREPLALLCAADKRPHDQVRHVNRNGLAQACEPCRVLSYRRRVSVGFEREDF